MLTTPRSSGENKVPICCLFSHLISVLLWYFISKIMEHFGTRSALFDRSLDTARFNNMQHFCPLLGLFEGETVISTISPPIPKIPVLEKNDYRVSACGHKTLKKYIL